MAALCLILLRTVIGWHFLTEGLWKVQAREGREFTAEPYLRASVGPFARFFREIVPDVDAKERLRRDAGGRPIGLVSLWRQELDARARHYHMTEAQRAWAEQKLEEHKSAADAWFLDPNNADTVQKYLDGLARVEAVEQNRQALASQREEALRARSSLDAARRELTTLVDGWTDELRSLWSGAEAVSDKQKARYQEYQQPLTQLDLVNFTTTWGLTLVGACLLVGLFTPLAALGGAGFLLLFYLSQPPWPGLPLPPNVEGHYLYVNKNLIELVACLVLATTRTGRWIGLDALLFGWRDRRERLWPSRRPDARDDNPPDSNPAPLKPDRPRGTAEPREPIPLG